MSSIEFLVSCSSSIIESICVPIDTPLIIPTYDLFALGSKSEKNRDILDEKKLEKNRTKIEKSLKKIEKSLNRA